MRIDLIIVVLLIISIILSFTSDASDASDASDEPYLPQLYLYCYSKSDLRQDEKTGKTYFISQNKDDLKAAQKLPIDPTKRTRPSCDGNNELGSSYGPGECGVCERTLPPGSNMTVCDGGEQGDAKRLCDSLNGVFRGYSPF